LGSDARSVSINVVISAIPPIIEIVSALDIVGKQQGDDRIVLHACLRRGGRWVVRIAAVKTRDETDKQQSEIKAAHGF
jgi:hypothetical protein